MADPPQARTSASTAPPDESERSALERGEEFLFHLYRGRDLLQDDRVHDAKRELEHALQLRPADLGAQELLAAACYRLGVYEHALQLYEDLRQRAGAPSSVSFHLALCRLKLGDTHGARRELDALTTHEPSHRRAWGYLAVCLHSVGDALGAEEAFRRGGHAALADRVSRGRSLMPSAPPPELAESAARAVAEALRALEPSAIDLVLADGDGASAEGPWHALELGRAHAAARATPRRATPLFPFEAVSAPEGANDDGSRSDGSPLAPSRADAAPVALPLLDAHAPSRGAEDEAKRHAERAVGGPARRALEAQRWLDRPVGLHAVGSRFATAVVDAERFVFVATRAIVASFGDLVHGERLAFGPAAFVAMRGGGALGSGGRSTALLGPSYGHEMTLFDLDGVDLTLAADAVVAFASTVRVFEDAESAPDRRSRFVRCSGAGAFAFEHRMAWAAVDLAESGPCVVRRSYLVGWTGDTRAEPIDEAECAEGRRGLLRLTGTGSALVLATHADSEVRATRGGSGL